MRFPLVPLIALTALVPSQIGGTAQPAAPAISVAFHHVHLNSLDPEAAIAFYASAFPTTVPAKTAGFAGVRSEHVYVLVDQASSPAPLDPPSAIWHFGWGSPTPAADVAKLVERGVPFYAPIARLASGTEFAYVKGPDGAAIEINTGVSRVFTHVHLFSDDPVSAGEWYETHLGAERRGGTRRTGPDPVPFAAPSDPGGVIRSPNATLRVGDVNLIIYPRQTAAPLVSTRGHVVDHLAVSCRDLDALLGRLTAGGVTILEPLHRFGSGPGRAAIIEGPDRIAIELVES